MCSLDLFPIPGFLAEADSASSSTYAGDPTRGRFQETRRSDELTYFPLHPFNTTHAETPPFQIPRRQPMLKTISNGEQPRDVVHRIENHLITESSKLTPALVGEKFVEPVLVDYKGKDCLMFVFGASVRFPLRANLWLKRPFLHAGPSRSARRNIPSAISRL